MSSKNYLNFLEETAFFWQVFQKVLQPPRFPGGPRCARGLPVSDQTEVTLETEGQDVNAPRGCHPIARPTSYNFIESLVTFGFFLESQLLEPAN